MTSSIPTVPCEKCVLGKVIAIKGLKKAICPKCGHKNDCCS